MEHNLTFGQWVKQLRKAKDLTQKELAQRVDCSVETIRKIEADVRRPSRQIAQRLADRLELPPEAIASFIRQARVPAGPEAWAGQVAPPPAQYPTNLLVPPTPLIGRDQDVVRICKHLSSDAVRLLTLTGAPGHYIRRWRYLRPAGATHRLRYGRRGARRGAGKRGNRRRTPGPGVEASTL